MWRGDGEGKLVDDLVGRYALIHRRRKVEGEERFLTGLGTENVRRYLVHPHYRLKPRRGN